MATFARFSSKLLCFAALAMTVNQSAYAVEDQEALSDVFVPGPKTAGATDSWALFNNPAGLALVDKAELVGGYAYRLNLEHEGLHQGQAAISLSLFEGFAIGAGLQLALPQSQDGDNKGALSAHFGAAIRVADFIAIGARATKLRHYDNVDSDPFHFSVGLECLLASWLSLGAYGTQVSDDIWAKPELHAGLAIKPFGKSFTLSAESRFFPIDTNTSKIYTVFPELGARLALGAFTLLASARVSDVAQGWSALTIFAGVEFNFDHVAVGLVTQGRTTNVIDSGARFRFSSSSTS